MHSFRLLNSYPTKMVLVKRTELPVARPLSVDLDEKEMNDSDTIELSIYVNVITTDESTTYNIEKRNKVTVYPRW